MPRIIRPRFFHAEYLTNCFHQQRVLGIVHAPFECLARIVAVDRYFLTDDQWTGVHAAIDKVHHHAAVCDLAALEGVIGAFNRIDAGERARQRRMQIDHAIREAL